MYEDMIKRLRGDCVEYDLELDCNFTGICIACEKAADVIEKLESELKSQQERIKQTDLNWEKSSEALKDEIERVKRERDAAIRDIRFQTCFSCEKYKNGCRPRRDELDGCAAYKWRGVREERYGDPDQA